MELDTVQDWLSFCIILCNAAHLFSLNSQNCIICTLYLYFINWFFCVSFLSQWCPKVTVWGHGQKHSKLCYPKQAVEVRFIQDSPSLYVFLTSPHYSNRCSLWSSISQWQQVLKWNMIWNSHSIIQFSSQPVCRGLKASFSGLRTQW